MDGDKYEWVEKKNGTSFRLIKPSARQEEVKYCAAYCERLWKQQQHHYQPRHNYNNHEQAVYCIYNHVCVCAWVKARFISMLTYKPVK